MPATVSVVIKSYNHVNHIAIALESVLSQSFQDFEIIVIDDGSTDASARVIAGYADPRLIFEAWPDNRGLSTAMNALIGKARGEFVAIVNSDDFALPGRLERQVAYLRAHPQAAAVFSQVRYVDDAGVALPDLRLFAAPLSFADFSTATWLRYFFFNGNCLCAPSAMVRRDAYARTGPYDPRLTNLQDLDVWVRMARAGELHVLNEALSGFRIRAENANLSAPRIDTQIRSQFEYYQVLRRYLDMDRDLLLDVFALDLSRTHIDASTDARRWLGELALTVDQPAHRPLGVQALYEAAATDADYRRLRETAGATNVFGIRLHTGVSLIPAWAFPDDFPEVDVFHLLADDETIAPQWHGECAVFRFSSQARYVVLRSPTFIAPRGDDRRLGVSISAVEIADSSGAARRVDIAGPELGRGFHGLEQDGNHSWRWTNGRGEFQPCLWAACSGDVTLTVRGFFPDLQRQTRMA